MTPQALILSCLNKGYIITLVFYWGLTLQFPSVTKIEFLSTILMQYQADKWWE